MSAPAPTAQVLGTYGRETRVACPLCGQGHSHYNLRPGTNRVAPGCGMHRSAAARLTGYTVNLPGGTPPPGTTKEKKR